MYIWLKLEIIHRSLFVEIQQTVMKCATMDQKTVDEEYFLSTHDLVISYRMTLSSIVSTKLVNKLLYSILKSKAQSLWSKPTGL